MIIFIFCELPNQANYSLKPTFSLGITTIFLLSLLLCESRFLKKIISFSGLRSRYRRLANRKKTCSVTMKFLQNFEGHDH